MTNLFQANMLLRKVVKQANNEPLVFKESLVEVGEAGVPEELHNVILWMLKGVHTVKTEERPTVDDRADLVQHPDSHILSLSMAAVHGLIVHKGHTTSLSATARQTYSLMTTAPIC